MPTLEHNALVEMFRETPGLAPHSLAILFHVDVPLHASVAVVESALDQLLPVEFRADLVLELRDASGVLVLAIVLEVQRAEDPDKQRSWPVYVTVVRARKRCPAIVLVVAPDAAVASWAAVYFQIIWSTLREPMRRALEAWVMERQTEGKTPDLPFVQEIFERGSRAGELKGLREGELRGLRDALRRLLARAGIALSENDHERIQACTDAATLDRWVENTLGAKTAADVFS